MSNQTVLRELFNLPKNETIFDDFTCSLNIFRGRLFISENNICFHSNFMKTKKIVIGFGSITKMEKSYITVALSSGLQISCGQKIYSFANFNTDRSIVYKTILAFWKNACPDVDFTMMEEEERDTKDIEDEDIEDEDSSHTDCVSSIPPPANSNNNKEESGGSEEEVKGEGIRKYTLEGSSNSSLCADPRLPVLSMQPTPHTQTTNTNTNANPNIPLNPPAIHNKKTSTPHQLDHVPPLDNEIDRFILHIKLSEFQERFLQYNSILGWDKFYTYIDCRDVENEEWSATGGENGEKKRRMTMNFRIRGLPFRDFAFTVKEQRIRWMEDNSIIINSLTVNRDIPYASSFEIHEIHHIMSSLLDPNYVLIRFSCQVIFIKSCIIRGNITNATLKGLKGVIQMWKDIIKKKRLNVSGTLLKKEQHLDHNVEKAYETHLDFTDIKYQNPHKKPTKNYRILLQNIGRVVQNFGFKSRFQGSGIVVLVAIGLYFLLLIMLYQVYTKVDHLENIILKLVEAQAKPDFLNSTRME